MNQHCHPAVRTEAPHRAHLLRNFISEELRAHHLLRNEAGREDDEIHALYRSVLEQRAAFDESFDLRTIKKGADAK